jgi:multiple sugar transport system substrate-binding protein
MVPTATLDPSPPVISEESTRESAQQSKMVTVWINERPDSQNSRLEELVDGFTEKSGIDVDLVLVSPNILPELVQTAVISGTLPDVILHPIEYSFGWAKEGIIDAGAATEVLDSLGRESFDPAALNLLSLDDSGAVPSIPSHGWQQIILYRDDWFAENDLEPPGTYDALSAAAEILYQPESVITGIVIPTDSALLSTQQAFEFIAAANGCELVNETGEITVLHTACLEALEFYRSLVNQFSPIGVQTDISALNAYLSGRSGIIFTTPSVLPMIAGLDDQFKPSCPSCTTTDFLVDNSGILTNLVGSGDFSQTANFGSINAIGIAANENTAKAQLFVEYWFNEGYETWLSIAPERQVPMRTGTGAAPHEFIDAWRRLPVREGQPSLVEIFGEESVDLLSNQVASTSRWGFPERQGEIITRINQEMVLPQLLQEMLSGYFTSSQTIVEMYRAIIDLIPFYAFPVEIAVTEET